MYYPSGPQLRHEHHHQHQQHQQHLHQHHAVPVPLQQMPPLTPLDFAYSNAISPSNLLASPYFVNSFQSPLIHPVHAHVHAHAHAQAQALAQAAYAQALRFHSTSSPSLNFKLHNNNQSATSLSGTTAQELSRTVLLMNLNDELTLENVLDFIDYGPIEYCKMVKKSSQSTGEVSQTLYISFLNSKITSSFHSKYAKNKENLGVLRLKLNSKLLKIALQDPSRSKNDLIKLKTLNYVMDFDATRSIILVGDLNESIKSQCMRFGEIEKIEDYNEEAQEEEEVEEIQTLEDLLVDPVDKELENGGSKVTHLEALDSASSDTFAPSAPTPNLEPMPDLVEAVAEATQAASKGPKSKSEAILIHYTSIDSAIRCYEYYIKIIKSKTPPSSLLSLRFSYDRCNRSEILPSSPSSSQPNNTTGESTTASSPTISRRATLPQPSSFLPNESIISIPEDDSFASEASELSEFNPLMILENNESIRRTLLRKKAQRMSDQISSSSGHDRDNEQGDDEDDDDVEIESQYNPQQTIGSSQYMNMGMMNPMMLPMMLPMGGVPTLNGSINGSGSYFQVPTSYSYNPDPSNAGNRTIYLGNLHPSTSIEDIANNVRAGGIVQYIRHYPEKKVCFITFIDPAVALKFYLNHQVLHQLVIHGYDTTVGWAKNHSGLLPREIALAVTAGASRNVYIGLKANPNGIDDCDKKDVLPDEQTLRRDFSKFGELEQINFFHNKDCGFLNFLNISDAIKVVDYFSSKNIEKINRIVGDSGEFYEKYSIFKISFAKDRCGNPPKFNFKKKNRGSGRRLTVNSSILPYNADEDLYEVDIVNESRLEEERRRRASISRSIEPEISEEAALVFCITSMAVKEDEDLKNVESDVVDGEKIAAKHENEKPAANANPAAAELEDETDSDDEVSIIINEDESFAGSKNASPQRYNPQTFHTANSNKVKHQKLKKSAFNSGFSQRNTSNISLSSLGKVKNYNPNQHQYQYQQQMMSHSPFPYQQPMYFLPPGSQRSSISRGSSTQGNFYNYAPPTPPPSHGMPYHHLSMPPSPQPNFIPQAPVFPQMQYYGGRSDDVKMGTSGSQVMAQYLAQTQNDIYNVGYQ